MSSRPQQDGSPGGLERPQRGGGAEEKMWNSEFKNEGTWEVRVFSTLGDEPSVGLGGIAHHLAADWDCAAMIMWEGPLSALCCWPIPASTDMAIASAAALELRPFCPVEGLGAKELCWITGAGEPVGSDMSFMLSSAAIQKNKKATQAKIFISFILSTFHSFHCWKSLDVMLIFIRVKIKLYSVTLSRPKSRKCPKKYYK